jgi:hypothetical protein
MENGNIIERLAKDELLNLVLVSLISSDTLIDIDSCKKSLFKMLIYRDEIKTANIENKNFYVKMIDEGIEIIERELRIFKEENNG